MLLPCSVETEGEAWGRGYERDVPDSCSWPGDALGREPLISQRVGRVVRSSTLTFHFTRGLGVACSA